MLRYKDDIADRLRREWEDDRVPWLLRYILAWLVQTAAHYGEDVTMTRLFSTIEENKALGSVSNTHPEWRAGDFRIIRDFEVSNKIRDDLNRLFPITLVRMTRVPPLKHGTAPHFHIQIARPEYDLCREIAKLGLTRMHA